MWEYAWHGKENVLSRNTIYSNSKYSTVYVVVYHSVSQFQICFFLGLGFIGLPWFNWLSHSEPHTEITIVIQGNGEYIYTSVHRKPRSDLPPLVLHTVPAIQKWFQYWAVSCWGNIIFVPEDKFFWGSNFAFLIAIESICESFSTLVQAVLKEESEYWYCSTIQ